jgi:glycosyltransferase involved in cell wall biosynthesis
VGPSIVAEGGDTESFGVVFTEALASGCPVIASDVGGIKDVVIHNLTGIMVPERDPKAIADRIRKLITNNSFRDQLRDAGLCWVKDRFDHQVVADRYAEVIQQVGTVSR